MANAKSDKKGQIRLAAEADLVTFIRLVAPYRVLGKIHEELCEWWQREDAKVNQLCLLPRDHGKSAMVGFRCAQRIARQPDIRIIYVSSTAALAEKQLKFIKDIITSPIFRFYWPGYVHEDEGKREKWTNSEIMIDHPLRKEEGIRDATVYTGGLTTALTGLHADVIVFDDVVVYENAYTSEGREKVKSQYSLMNSVAAADSEEWVVGTRYDPRDLYGEMISMEQEIYDEEGNLEGSEPIYEVFERQVEDVGDGTGNFLWPRQKRKDGKWFGFDQKILSAKRAKYLDRRQYRAQYYNDPNDLSESAIDRSKFQYYDRKHLKRDAGIWYYQGQRLNIYAAIDFAFSVSSRADYTALVVIGINANKDIYVLDIARAKTNRISDYFKMIMDYHVKWDFRKLRAEVTVAQTAIVKELKSNYIRQAGLALSVDEFRPSRHQGSKEERMRAILEPRYDNQQVWHPLDGYIQTLEEELILENPPHDDVKDALAAAIDVAIPPMHSRGRVDKQTFNNNVYNSKFGGVSFR